MNIKSSDGNPVLSKEGKAERWKEYIEGLYKGDVLEDNIMEMEENVDEDEMGDMILCEEFDRALKDLSRNKAPGVDNIPLELLTALGEPVLTKLYHLVSKMYETDEIPSDFKKNIIIPIPKKAGVDRCRHRAELFRHKVKCQHAIYWMAFHSVHLYTTELLLPQQKLFISQAAD
ncbi:uncharacterized protein LOC126176469 [Schistocerca cancellata]|uniref:uncharacterized protein LOC126176469 n=1 Tax=Schistocerca cancellata TaxID=274614 RepID=UPI00211779EF|nr:uncharacterized protein LOC126176469 [Schistocerca cancellata]